MVKVKKHVTFDQGLDFLIFTKEIDDNSSKHQRKTKNI